MIARRSRPPDLTSTQKPSPHVLLAAFETILRTTADPENAWLAANRQN